MHFREHALRWQELAIGELAVVDLLGDRLGDVLVDVARGGQGVARANGREASKFSERTDRLSSTIGMFSRPQRAYTVALTG